MNCSPTYQTVSVGAGFPLTASLHHQRPGQSADALHVLPVPIAALLVTPQPLLAHHVSRAAPHGRGAGGQSQLSRLRGHPAETRSGLDDQSESPRRRCTVRLVTLLPPGVKLSLGEWPFDDADVWDFWCGGAGGRRGGQRHYTPLPRLENWSHAIVLVMSCVCRVLRTWRNRPVRSRCSPLFTSVVSECLECTE